MFENVKLLKITIFFFWLFECRYVPVRADQEENQQFLRSKRAKDRNLLEVYERYDNTAAAFEDATFWMPALLKAITSLGEPLLG